jgi:hypothetical protein
MYIIVTSLPIGADHAIRTAKVLRLHLLTITRRCRRDGVAVIPSEA